MGLVSEDEADVARVVPTVQMPGLRELGIAPQRDYPEAGPATEVDGLVQENVGLCLLRGAVAATVDQVERFGGAVGQRDQERMVAPGAVIGDVDTLLALGISLDEGAVGIEDRFLEELRGAAGARRACESG